MTIPESIRAEYEHWHYFLMKQIDFSLRNSEKHTKEHCARVLLYALLIAKKAGISRSERELLCTASVFHDSRRQDDWLDVGHGQRAADYYKAFCQTHPLTYDERIYRIMAFHDLDDNFGETALSKLENGILLYHIFKDADALDRFRLGPNALDIRYLRTQEAKSLYNYAKQVWECIGGIQ